MAILHVGMFREFENCVKTKKILEKYFECDHYVSTWSISKQKYDNDDSYKEYEVTPEMIQKFLPNSVFDIKNQNSVFTSETLPSNKMFYHWQNAFRLVKESGKSYDLIFILRTDSNIKLNGDINKKLFLKNTISKEAYQGYEEIFHIMDDVIYGNLIFVRRFKPKLEYHISDIFFFGEYNIMSRFITTLPNFENNPINFCPHKDLANHIINNIKTHTDDCHPFIVEIVRKKKN